MSYIRHVGTSNDRITSKNVKYRKFKEALKIAIIGIFTGQFTSISTKMHLLAFAWCLFNLE